jgi:hypothetical protein
MVAYDAQRSSIPQAVKIAFTGFVAVLAPSYWWWYGPANFLWLCNIALFTTVVALWWESPFLASMQLVGIFLLDLVWQLDLLWRLATGNFLIGMTHYMFAEHVPRFIRALSLYHVWLPYLLLWLVWRLGYDGRGWIAQTFVTWIVLPICFCFTNPDRQLNIVFGPSREDPDMSGRYLLLTMLFYPLAIYLPSHLLARWIFSPADRAGMPASPPG